MGFVRNHPPLPSQSHRLCAVLGAELRKHGADVELHRPLADRQARGDLAIGKPGGHQPEHLALAVDVPYFPIRDVALKSASEFRAVEKQLLDLLYSPAEMKG